ncbi:hypothetical protein ACFQX8_02950 [Klenkia terrae]|uniref:hypothetical protein n=1 Tax=Klenkia terrae TaxID=1052259 RepID=UPI00361C5B1A
MRVQRRRVADRWSWTDLRLVPPALGVWATTLVAPLLPALAAAVVAAGSVVLAVALGRHRGAGAVRRAVVALLAGVAVAAAAGAVRTGSGRRRRWWTWPTAARW